MKKNGDEQNSKTDSNLKHIVAKLGDFAGKSLHSSKIVSKLPKLRIKKEW
jgi:hypothetical protein